MTREPLPPLEGVPGTDATASKRGYYYQDVATALAWVQLPPEQTLYIEVAEDYAIERGAHAEVNQVRDVAASLTLPGVVPFLEHTVQLLKGNPVHKLSFVYRTTSRIGEERAIADRPMGVAGLLYWKQVKEGGNPEPLIDVLRRLATPGSELANYLNETPTNKVVEQLIQAVTWATNQPTSAILQKELTERVATFTHDELKVDWSGVGDLLPVVINAVTQTSTQDDIQARKLTRYGLIRLLSEVTLKKIPYAEYQQLKHDAELAKNASVDPLDRDIEHRLLKLRKARLFLGEDLAERVKSLAREVRDGGNFELATARLRAFVLSWCARMLIGTEDTLAHEFLLDAKRLSAHPHIELVEALLLSKQDMAAALQSIVHRTDKAATTIRYAMQRLGSASGGLIWAETAVLKPMDFDPDGMCIVLCDCLRQHRWPDALAWLEEIPAEACAEYPALRWWIAVALLAYAIAPPMQHRALEGPPVMTDIPLSNEPEALLARRRAVELFQAFHRDAAQLDLQDQSDAALEFGLWLQLRDRVTQAMATADVLQRWEESKHDSRWLPLVLAAKLPLNRVEEAESIDQRAARYGSLTFLDARARLALVLSSPAHEWLDRWPQIRANIKAYFSEGFLELNELEALLQSGRLDEARAVFDKASHLPAITKERFKLRIEKSGDIAQEIATLRLAAANDDHKPADLQLLIQALVQAEQIAEAVIPAKSLFDLTKSHEDAERWLQLLYREQRWEEIESFLDAHPEQVEQSHNLAGLYLEALLRHARWDDARNLANGRPELIGQRISLDVQLAIFSGDWDRLWGMLEAARKDVTLSLEDQLMFAQLATNLDRIAAAKQLVHAAAKRSDNDPGVLMNCYMLAVQGRWEDDPATAKWMQQAIALSSEDGPVQAKSLEDLVAMAPQWREHTATLAQGLAKGEMYLSLAAQQVNRPLTSVMLGTAESNRSARDFRHRSPINAFAGIARATHASVPLVIAIDQTALLTLGHLHLLPMVLENFRRIWVPHSVGAWLFTERQEVRFHQPSRIHQAKTLLDSLAKGKLHLAALYPDTSRELIDHIGADLAQLIRAAQTDRQKGEDAFVIRVSPIHRANSLGKVDANVSEYFPLLRSTLELISSLQAHGAISEEQAASYRRYLSTHDHGWKEDSRLPMGATLYLDDLTATYFHYLGLWESAQRIFRLVIHPNEQQEAIAFTELESTTNNLDEIIEEIRQFLVDGQKSGKLGFLRQPARGPDSDRLGEHPKFLLIQTLERQDGIEAVVVDDRAANKFSTYTYPDGKTVAMRCSLDVIDWLRDTKAINDKVRLSLRNDLRRSGYVFIPIEAGEFEESLKNAIVRDGAMVETANGRAIRENHLLAQACGMLQLPVESAWLTNIGFQTVRAITSIWQSSDDESQAAAKSEWLVDYSRWDGLAGRMPPPWTEERLNQLDSLALGRLLTGLHIPADRRDAYNNWIGSNYLDELKYEQPQVYEALCTQIASQLLQLQNLVIEARPEYSENETKAATAIVSRQMLSDLPASILDSLSGRDNLLGNLGLSRTSQITVHLSDDHRFDTLAIYGQASRLFNGATNVSAIDNAGDAWNLELVDDGQVVCRQAQSGRWFHLKYASLISNDPTVRIRCLETVTNDHGLTPDQLAGWFDAIRTAPFDVRHLTELESDLADAPLPVASRIEQLFREGSLRIVDLRPLSLRYYNRLVLPYGDSATLSQFAAILADRNLGSDLVGQAKHELLWSAHGSLVPKGAIAAMDADDLRTLCADLLPHIDLWSLTGLIETIAQRPDVFTSLFDELVRLLKALQTAISDDDGRLRLTVALGSLVDAALNTCGLFIEAPVFWRRHASLAHAALIERSALALGVPPADLASWAWNSVLRFQIASIADLVREPRWSGFLFNELQLKQELLSRVMMTLEQRRDDAAGKLDNLVFGDNPESLSSQRIVYLSALPGPIEGGTEPATLPEPLLEQLRSTLSDENASLAHRTLTVAHLAGMGGVPDEIWDHLTVAVEQLHQSDITDDERESWPTLLMRLSLTAALSRHSELANAILKLIHGRAEIPLGLRVLAGLTACGVHSKVQAWTSAAAEFIGQCARMDLSKKDAEYLLYVLRTLGRAQPLLRPSIGQTLAQLQGVARSIG